jgi:uncharacterized protein (TIRG00374 family)
MKLKKRQIVSFIISLVLLIVLFSRADFFQIMANISKANVLFILLGIVCSFTILASRLVRWRIFMNIYKLKISRFNLISTYLASQFVANLTPVRVGEVARLYFMKKKCKTSFFYLLPAILVERFIDVVVLLIIALAFFTLYSFFVSTALQFALLLTSCVLIAFLFVILRKTLAMRLSNYLLGLFKFIPAVKKLKPQITDKMNKFYNGFSKMKTARMVHFLEIFLLTVLCYALEGAILYLATVSLSAHLPYSFAVGFIALAVLGGAISTLPGGLGSFEAILFALLVFNGFAEPLALSIAVLYRFISFAMIVLFCSIFFFRETR